MYRYSKRMRNSSSKNIGTYVLLAFLFLWATMSAAQYPYQTAGPSITNHFDHVYSVPLQPIHNVNQDTRITAPLNKMGMNDWTTIGPFGWGNFYSLTINPSNSNIILANNDGISLYKSVDGGANWTIVQSLEEAIESRFSKAPIVVKFVPNQPNTVYAMAYDGLYKSIDNGENWSKTGSSFVGLSLQIDPNNADVVFTYSWDGIYRTLDAGENWEKLDEQLNQCTLVCIDPTNSNIIYAGGRSGLWKSDDAGNTWMHLAEGLPQNADVSTIAIDPFDHNKIFLGLWNVEGLYTSMDGGSHWEQAGLKGNSIRHFIFDPHHQAQWMAASGDSLFFTSNGDADWQNITDKLPFTPIIALEFDPSLADVLYYSASMIGIFKSSNLAATWSEMQTFARTGIWGMTIPENNADVIYASTRTAGLLKSIDKGQSWRQIKNEFVWGSIAVHPENTDIIYYPNWQGLNKSIDGGETWQLTPTDVRFRWLAISPEQPEVLFAGEKGLYRSVNDGQDWERLGFDNYYIIEPIAFHPTSPDTLYVGVDQKGLYRSIDGGDTWEETNNGMPISTIRDIDISPTEPKVIYISTYQNGVYRTTNAGENWEYAGLCGNDVMTVAVSPLNSNIVIAGCDNHGGNSEGVYLSVNGGRSWSAMRKGLPSTEIKELLFDPGDPRRLYAGTERHSIWEYTFPETQYDILANQIILPKKTSSPTASFKPKFEVVNLGARIAANVQVVCIGEKIESGSPHEIYQSTKSISSISSYEQKSVEFDIFAPQGAGEYQFTFFHTFVNDENHSNDTLSIQTRTALFIRPTNYTNVADARGGRGAAVTDYNLDGFADIYQTMYEENQLLNNQQNGFFIDKSHEQGVVNGIRDSKSAGWFDFDNDGDADLLVLNNNGFSLFRNDAEAFTNVTLQSGIRLARDLLGLAIGDYNSDGFLDFYATRFGKANIFYSNDGDGTFTNITVKSGLGESDANSSSAKFFDFNADGRQDLLVVNHSANYHLYINNGDTTFTEISEQVGLVDGGNAHHALIFDYNNDGMLDLYLINSEPDFPENILYQNNNSVFTNVSEQAGVADAGDGQGGVCGDFDNDGFVDIYISNRSESNVLYHNNGDGTFTNIAEQAAVDDAANGMGVAAADFDNDGDLDIYLVNDGQPNAMFYNTTTGNNWLQIKAVGQISNRDAMGSMVKVVAGDRKMIRLLDGNPGWDSQSSLIAAFGLGNATSIDSIIIYWPSGIIQDTTNVAVNQLLSIFEDISQVDVENKNQGSQMPITFAMQQNYPNPFNSQTTIQYQLAKPAMVNLTIYNYLGQEIQILVQEFKNTGRYSIKWDGKNRNGENIVSGVYFYRIKADNFIDYKKMALIR